MSPYDILALGKSNQKYTITATSPVILGKIWMEIFPVSRNFRSWTNDSNCLIYTLLYRPSTLTSINHLMLLCSFFSIILLVKNRRSLHQLWKLHSVLNCTPFYEQLWKQKTKSWVVVLLRGIQKRFSAAGLLNCKMKRRGLRILLQEILKSMKQIYLYKTGESHRKYNNRTNKCSSHLKAATKDLSKLNEIKNIIHNWNE